MKHSARKWIFLLSIPVTGGLLYWAIRQVEFPVLLETLRTTSPLPVLAGVMVLFAGLCVQALRWRICLPSTTDRLYPKLLHATLISMFFNNLLPSMIGGDLYRAAHVSKNLGLRTTIQSLLLVRLSNLWGAALLPAPVALFYLDRLTTTTWMQAVTLVSLGVWVWTLALPLHARILDGVGKRVPNSWIASACTDLRMLIGDHRLLLKLILSSWLFQATNILAHIFFAKGLNLPIEPHILILIVPAVLILTTLPFSINGLGVREGALIIALGTWGVTDENALAFSILSYCTLLLLSALGGVLFLVHWIRCLRTST